MTNPSISKDTRLGTALALPAGPVQTVALADINQNLLRTADAGVSDGTSFLGGAVTLMLLPSAAYTTSIPANATFSTAGITYGALDFNVTAFTGGTNPSITFFLDRLAADGLWYNIFASNAETTPVAYSVDLSPSVTAQTTSNPNSPGAAIHCVFTSQGRFRWTFAGAPTSVTFSASIIGR